MSLPLLSSHGKGLFFGKELPPPNPRPLHAPERGSVRQGRLRGGWGEAVGQDGAPPAQTYLSLLAIRRNSRTVMAFFWMLYCVKRPDCPVTTCWMGAGITSSSMSS